MEELDMRVNFEYRLSLPYLMINGTPWLDLPAYIPKRKLIKIGMYRQWAPHAKNM